MFWLTQGGGFWMTSPSWIVLLRHGAYQQRKGAPSARQPFALTSDGLAQAEAGAVELGHMMAEHGLRPDPVIYSSRQLRAWQTADRILAHLRHEGHALEGITQTSALAERGLGSAANLTVSEIEAVLDGDPRYGPPPEGWKSDSDYRLPLEGAESLMEAGQRVADHLLRTLRPGHLSIHVGHGASFRHACHLLGVIEKEKIAALSVFHARPLLLCHEGHGKWQHLAGAWKVRAAGEAPID